MPRRATQHAAARACSSTASTGSRPAAVTFQDHFSAVSAAYAAFRPRYPDALFEFVAREAPDRDTAWDAGTGSGQAALGLAHYFAHVMATDASEAQIQHATAHERVSYRIAPAEASGLED